MNYIIINPRTKRCGLAAYASFDAALRAANLNPGEVDHGTVTPILAIAVYQFGMLDPADSHKYFSLGGVLYAGSAVCYAVNGAGETVNATMHQLPPLIWYRDARAAELAMARGELTRPILAFNNDVIWQWPAPGGRAAAEEAARRAAQKMIDDDGATVIDGDTVITTWKD